MFFFILHQILNYPSSFFFFSHINRFNLLLVFSLIHLTFVVVPFFSFNFHLYFCITFLLIFPNLLWLLCHSLLYALHLLSCYFFTHVICWKKVWHICWNLLSLEKLMEWNETKISDRRGKNWHFIDLLFSDYRITILLKSKLTSCYV